MISYDPRSHLSSMRGSSRSPAVQPVVPGRKGLEDVATLQLVYLSDKSEALATLLGRQPALPPNCRGVKNEEF